MCVATCDPVFILVSLTLIAPLYQNNTRVLRDLERSQHRQCQNQQNRLGCQRICNREAEVLRGKRNMQKERERQSSLHVTLA